MKEPTNRSHPITIRDMDIICKPLRLNMTLYIGVSFLSQKSPIKETKFCKRDLLDTFQLAQQGLNAICMHDYI